MIKLVEDELRVLLDVLDALLLNISHMEAQVLLDKAYNFDLENETKR